MCGGTTWAPSAPDRARAPCLSPVPLQTVADLLRVGISWTELSNLTTFLLFLKGGSQAEATATAREFSELIFTLFPFSWFFFFFFLLPRQLTWYFWKTNLLIWLRLASWHLTFDRHGVNDNAVDSLLINWPSCWCYDRELRRCMCAR